MYDNKFMWHVVCFFFINLTHDCKGSLIKLIWWCTGKWICYIWLLLNLHVTLTFQTSRPSNLQTSRPSNLQTSRQKVLRFVRQQVLRFLQFLQGSTLQRTGWTHRDSVWRVRIRCVRTAPTWMKTMHFSSSALVVGICLIPVLVTRCGSDT